MNTKNTQKRTLIPKRTLGPISAEFIYKLIEQGKPIFSLTEAEKIYGKDRHKTTDFLRDLVKRGVLARIKSGVFVILQMGQENTQMNNWPVIAEILAGANDYYISHYSAMRLHGMTTHPVLNVTITLSKKYPPKRINNLNYQFVFSKPENFWGRTELWINKNKKIWASDIERTILDGLDRPDLCGGIVDVCRGIWSKQKVISWDKLLKYAIQHHSKAVKKRLGFILETLNLGNHVLPLLAQNISGKDYILLDPAGQKTGKYTSMWHVRINLNMDELKEGVWG